MSFELPRRKGLSTRGLKYFWSVLGGSALGFVLVAWRGFYWQHAFLVGLAGAALIYSALRTVENLRRLR